MPRRSPGSPLSGNTNHVQNRELPTRLVLNESPCPMFPTAGDERGAVLPFLRSTETQKWQNCSSLITRPWKHWTRTFVQHQSGGQLTVLNMVGIAGQGTTRGPSRHCSKLARSLRQSCKAPMECERCSERTESQNNYELIIQ